MFSDLSLSGIELSLDIAIFLGVIAGGWRLYKYFKQKGEEKKRVALEHSLELQEKIWDFYVSRNRLETILNAPQGSNKDENTKRALIKAIQDITQDINILLKSIIQFYTYLSIANPGGLFDHLEKDLADCILELKKSGPDIAVDTGYASQIVKLLALQSKLMDLGDSNLTGAEFQKIVYSIRS